MASGRPRFDPVRASDLDLTFPRWSLQVSSRDMRDISPLLEAGAELAITPTEPLAPPRPSAWNRKWTAAIVVSCLLHAAVAAAFLISPARDIRFQGCHAVGRQRSVGRQRGRQRAGSGSGGDECHAGAEPATDQARTGKGGQAGAANRTFQARKEAAKQPVEPLPEAVKQPAATPGHIGGQHAPPR